MTKFINVDDPNSGDSIDTVLELLKYDWVSKSDLKMFLESILREFYD